MQHWLLRLLIRALHVLLLAARPALFASYAPSVAPLTRFLGRLNLTAPKGASHLVLDLTRIFLGLLH